MTDRHRKTRTVRLSRGTLRGLSQAIIDAVKYRRPLGTGGEKEAVIVQLGRDAITNHKVGQTRLPVP